MYRRAAGTPAASASRSRGLQSSPKIRAPPRQTAPCPMARGSSGSKYPKIKSRDLSGVVYSRRRNALVRSLATRRAENREKKLNPKTKIPGVKLGRAKMGTGTLACMAQKSPKSASGNANPKARFSGSRKISRPFRRANSSMLMVFPPILPSYLRPRSMPQRHPPGFPVQSGESAPPLCPGRSVGPGTECRWNRPGPGPPPGNGW